MVYYTTLLSAARRAALLFLTLFAAVTAYSQTFTPDHFNLNHTYKAQLNNPVTGELKIVAVMVEFQPDTNRFTSGNGTFGPGSIPYLENPGTNIDPLPHDKPYFEAHLEFVKNYFENASKGELTINYQVLDKIYRLPNEMKEYSPIGVDPPADPLAEFARDVWAEVAADGAIPLNFTPDQNTAFVVFHAGVGRDIQLTGTTLDKTPQDIPSVYLSRDAIARLFDDPSFSGFPIDNGNVLVSNTVIAPRTLSRAGEDITGNQFVLSLSTNGLLTAQIGSHLGLPDLFNTQTGESGIGRFGLMDGAGIFAYNGIFPPELSAWEKTRLGWEVPVELEPQPEQEFSLPAAVLKEPNSIARISVSNDEYFLVENRHRDPDNSGVTLTIQRPDGSLTQQTFTNSDTSFVFQFSDFADQLESGVVTNVSNYDFALPGGPVGAIDDINEQRVLNGGILIWHIDESIIRSQLAARNGVNDNPERRGVELMEADGAQDIGRPAQIGFFQNEVNGSAFDFWWSGNNASVITPSGTITLYENRFGPDTTPDNNTKSGSPSFFELFDFSDNLPVASFSIRPASPNSDLYTLVDSRQNLPLTYYTSTDSRPPLAVVPFSYENRSFALIPAQNGLQIYNFIDNTLSDVTGITGETVRQPFLNSTGDLFSVAQNSSTPGEVEVDLYEWDGSTATVLWNFETGSFPGFISQPSQNILQFDGTRARGDIQSQTIDTNFYPEAGHFSELRNGFQTFVSNSGSVTVTTPSGTASTALPAGTETGKRLHSGLFASNEGNFDSYVLSDNKLFLFTNTGNEIETITLFDSPNIEWPSITDFNNDGLLDFIVIKPELNQVTAKNRNGAVLDNFPITAPDEVLFKGTPLVADINGDGNNELLVTGQDPFSLNIYAYDNRGRLMSGFPLLAGSVNSLQDDPVQAAFTGNNLLVLSHTGDLKVWNFPQMENAEWASRYGNSGNNKITGLAGTETVTAPDFGVLNKADTYNWPNPATDHTFIRFQTGEPGEVNIKITTLSGRLIYDRTVQARGGQPEEIEIDTSRWGSGGYLALVTATVNGQTERKLVKIAIAR